VLDAVRLDKRELFAENGNGHREIEAIYPFGRLYVARSSYARSRPMAA
jgi:hypothetical protein